MVLRHDYNFVVVKFNILIIILFGNQCVLAYYCLYKCIYCYRVSRARVFATGMKYELLTPGRE